MDVCVLGCTPGHIPRYMGQTSNNKNWCLLWLLLWFLCYTCSYLLYLYSNPLVSRSYLIILWVSPTWYPLLYAHLCPSCFATWLSIPLAWGVSLTPLDLTFRSWSLERVDSLPCWSEWRSGSVVLQLSRERSLILFIYVYSLYSRICAY